MKRSIQMKKLVIMATIGLIMTGSVFAGVVKKTKVEVAFKDFGKFSSEQSEMLTLDKKVTDSKNDFKGKGITGKLSGTFFLKSGETGEIIDLPAMSITRIDHKKKEYRLEPIERITAGKGAGESSGTDETDVQETEENSDIKIIRSEFKVEETAESKTINNFSSKKYVITWVTEWENVKTGEKGTDRLETDVWATPLTGGLQQAREEEMKFTKAYMQSIGIDADSLQQMMLGTNWLALLGSISGGNQKPQHQEANFSDEMKKIKGYPVVIDGKYFATREGGQNEEEKENDTGGGVKGMLGGLAKKALKKSPKDGNEPAFTYYTELIEFSPVNVGEDAFQIPANYKKKG
jgi:hypothetical protein